MSKRAAAEPTWHGPDQLRALLLPIDELQPHPRNPRRGDVSAMTASLTDHGQYRAAVVQAGSRHILAGNHMWQAAKALGWTHLAVIERDLDDEAAHQLMLADNRVADRGAYDQEALAQLLGDLAAADALAPTGYTADDLDDLLAELGAVPTLPPEPRPAAAQAEGADEAAQRDLTRPGRQYRDLQLMVPAGEWTWFSAALDALRQHYGMDKVTDVVLRAVADAHRAAAVQEPQPA